ncbi:MAG TPA: glycosyltransferase family 2 protein [Phycisphaerales bacterium]|nr:glycosyltransferase family 2 protein [Phycisphaerales bacterium]
MASPTPSQAPPDAQSGPVPRRGEREVPAAAPAMAAVAAPLVAVLMVTWNRKEMVSSVLAALARQTYPRERLLVTVTDNASTDGTLEYLAQRWKPEAIVENSTQAAHEPAFAPPRVTGERNAGGFARLTLIANRANMGGCGGFNTGFAYAEHAYTEPAPDFVWLVDDDVDLPPETLERLVGTAESDPSIGIVGTRTVDIADRATTIESTIYLDRARGVMRDDAPPGHRLHESHRRFVTACGAPKGAGPYTGTTDVDVATAASLLARWSAVRRVGFWDWRYFIYCDDADWCLRFGKAGYRVVLNLDAVVYHTPWNLKLTPARLYYAQRNLVWMLRKVLPAGALRRVVGRRVLGVLRDAAYAATHRRLFAAEIIRRTADDTVRDLGGKRGWDGPAFEPALEALRRCGALRPGARVAVLLCVPWAPKLAEALRGHVAAELAAGRGLPGEVEPAWVYVRRNDVELPAGDGVGVPPAEEVVYGHRRRSRLKKQLPFLRRPPTAVVVVDQSNDFPMLRGRWNIHIDPKRPGMAQVERDGPRARAAFLARWLVTAARVGRFVLTVRPYTSPTKYG